MGGERAATAELDRLLGGFGVADVPGLRRQVARWTDAGDDRLRAEVLDAPGRSLAERVFLATAALRHGVTADRLALASELLPRVVHRPPTWLALHCRVARAAWLAGAAVDPTQALSDGLWPAYRRFLDRHFPEPARASGVRTDGRSQRVVLVAPQLLTVQHAPTRVLMEYARVLAGVGGRDVLVVDAELMPVALEAPVDEAFVANRNPTLPDEGFLDVGGVAVPFHRPRARAFSVEKVLLTLERVLRHQPDVVLSYGNWNVVGDLAAECVPTVQIPAARERAFSLAHAYLFPARTERESTPPGGGRLLPGQRGRYEPYTFMPARFDDPACPPTRSELGLPEDGVVLAVTGNRLRTEIDDDFVAVIRAVLAAAPDAVIAVVGDPSGAGLREAMPVPVRPRVLGFAYQNDLRAFLRRCDAVLDPFRRGGGTSGYVAMLEGKPVLTRGDGDLRNYLGGDLVTGDLPRYRARAIELATRADARADLGAAVSRRVAAIPLLEDALGELDAVIARARALHLDPQQAA